VTTILGSSTLECSIRLRFDRKSAYSTSMYANVRCRVVKVEYTLGLNWSPNQGERS
jgi:hypothetical protein